MKKVAKGPWKYVNGLDMILAKDDQMLICDIRGYGHLHGATNLSDKEACEIMDANGRVISKVPEMLEILKRIYVFGYSICDEEETLELLGFIGGTDLTNDNQTVK